MVDKDPGLGTNDTTAVIPTICCSIVRYLHPTSHIPIYSITIGGLLNIEIPHGNCARCLREQKVLVVSFTEIRSPNRCVIYTAIWCRDLIVNRTWNAGKKNRGWMICGSKVRNDRPNGVFAFACQLDKLT